MLLGITTEKTKAYVFNDFVEGLGFCSQACLSADSNRSLKFTYNTAIDTFKASAIIKLRGWRYEPSNL
jgi:hypothetical protein